MQFAVQGPQFHLFDADHHSNNINNSMGRSSYLAKHVSIQIVTIIWILTIRYYDLACLVTVKPLTALYNLQYNIANYK